MLKISHQSHLDHGLTPHQLAYALLWCSGKTEFFVTTILLPPEFGEVPCALHGPAVGTAPVLESEVTYAARGERAYNSRLVNRPVVPSRYVTVVGGPSGDDPCVLFTMYGGPMAPREPTDPHLTDAQRAEAEAFWREHALSAPVPAARADAAVKLFEAKMKVVSHVPVACALLRIEAEAHRFRGEPKKAEPLEKHADSMSAALAAVEEAS